MTDKENNNEQTSDSDNSKRNRPFERLLSITPGLFVVVILTILGFDAFGTKDSILTQLAKPEYARGLITLLFSIATIWVAIILVVGAFRTNDDKKFNRAKDVLIVLVGIFGTIVGFYFGSEVNQNVEQNKQPIESPIPGSQEPIEPDTTSNDL